MRWALGLVALATASLLAQAPVSGVRAMWVQRGTLTSPANILTLIESAKAAGFNTLIVQVRGRGDAYYASRHEPRAAALSRQPPAFDPLAVVLAGAHRAGLQVHVWVNMHLVSDATLPSLRGHLVYTHPEWLMVPRALAPELARVEPRSPEYLRRLAEYARSRSDRLEGVYLSPIHKGAADHLVRVVGDIVSHYPVDGVHLDYIRFPSEEFDFGEDALDEFRVSLLPHMSRTERREYAQRAKQRPFFYTEMFPQRWQEFRREKVTSLVRRIRTTVKDRRPMAVLSAAVFPDVNDALTRRFQDWGGWLQNGLLDVVCPMAYTPDAAIFRAQIQAVEETAGDRSVWAGIGSYRLSPAQTTEHAIAAQQLGAEGFVLFSYDNLNAAYLNSVSKALGF
jgi:uncharacterized lipoprotein YddW (UPF0748 family)